MEGTLRRDASSASVLALDPQMAADRLGALPHVEESEMRRGGRLPGSKTLAVITHGQAYRCRRVPQLDGNLPGAPVGHGIGNGFLPDAEQVHFNRTWESHRAALDLEVDLRLFAGHEWFDDLRQR